MRKICLFVLLQVYIVMGWAQETYTLAPHREYIDKVIDDAITYANQIKIEDSELSPLMRFAKRILQVMLSLLILMGLTLL